MVRIFNIYLVSVCELYRLDNVDQSKSKVQTGLSVSNVYKISTREEFRQK